MTAGSKLAKGSYIIGVNKSIIGCKVFNAEGEDLGKIEEIIIDSRDSRVAYAILSFGGFMGMGDKHFAIPWQALTLDASQGTAALMIEKDRLKNAPGFDKDKWPDMTSSTWATEVLGHYGYGDNR
jgi:hypothetical protein